MPVSESVSITERIAPDSADGVAVAIRGAGADRTVVYPLGGETALDYGLPARTPGVGLSLLNLNRVIEYPARDMTITVEAGITIAELARTLAGEGQRLPVDSPFANKATLGGLIATNHSGPLRYGYGTLRDYVIGIAAVDGAGRTFHGGGRVVKNVAGYDFCKLLIGSLGTLGVITQVTLKVKPVAAASALAVCDIADWELAERVLAGLVNSATTPALVELVSGPAWTQLIPGSGIGRLVVGLEGTAVEVAWMQRTLDAELQAHGIAARFLDISAAVEVRERLTHFSADAGGAIVLKAAVRPSNVTRFAKLLLEVDRAASIQAHAGNGIVVASLPHFSAAEVSRRLIGKLQPEAMSLGGHVVVLSCDDSIELTRQARWGNAGAAAELMQSIKQQFDPANILNRGRFVY